MVAEQIRVKLEKLSADGASVKHVLDRSQISVPRLVLRDVHVVHSGTSVGMTPVLNNSLLFSISAPRALAGSISVSISFEKV